MTIGVVSDTHGFFDPRLKKLLAGVETILHAGDVGSPEILYELRQIAPVRAVRGNVDLPDLDLPLTLTARLGSVKIEMMHILPVPQAELQAWSRGTTPGGRAPERSRRLLASLAESTGVVIFGHSHQPCLVNLGDRLFMNPGSAGRKRFSLPRTCGLLDLVPEGMQATILDLEGYNRRVLDAMRIGAEAEEPNP